MCVYVCVRLYVCMSCVKNEKGQQQKEMKTKNNKIMT